MRTINRAESLQALKQLDLTNVKRKLREPSPEGKAWTEEQANEAEKWYRRFMALVILEPQVVAVPNRPIDDFWHQHILDTRAYDKDCHAVFGEFLHHYPYFGLNGDAEQRDDSFDQTNAAYERHWGENCMQMSGFGFKPVAPCIAEPELASFIASNCNSGGSGTGCGQGCGGGSKRALDAIHGG